MECNKFEWFEWVVFAKYDKKIITDAKSMIHECLNCSFHKDGCRDWFDFVEFLDKNKSEEIENKVNT